MLEKDVEAYLVKCVKERGGTTYKLNGTGQRGWPDRLVVMPPDIITFAELKRPKGGRLSKAQKSTFSLLAWCGSPVWQLHTMEQIDDMMQRLFPPPPKLWRQSQQDPEEID